MWGPLKYAVNTRIGKSTFKALDILIDELSALIGTTTDTGGTETAGTAMAKLNSSLTSLDDIRSYTVTNNTASKTGGLSAKLSYLTSLLENSSYGLSAIKTSTTAFRKPTKIYKARLSPTAIAGSGKGVLFISGGNGDSGVTIVVDGITLGSKFDFASLGVFFIEFSQSFSVKDDKNNNSPVYAVAVFY